MPGVTRAPSFGMQRCPAGIASSARFRSAAPSFGMALSARRCPTPAIERGVAARHRIRHRRSDLPRARWRSFIRLIIALAAQHLCRRFIRPRVRASRRPVVLWARYYRPFPAGGRLCRSDLEGRKADRASGAVPGQVRAGRQSQDRKDARSTIPPNLLAIADNVIE